MALIASATSTALSDVGLGSGLRRSDVGFVAASESMAVQSKKSKCRRSCTGGTLLKLIEFRRAYLVIPAKAGIQAFSSKEFE